VDEAQARVLALGSPVEAEDCVLREALGRVTAGPVHSRIAVPPFANSAMDGFALRAADTTAPGPGVSLRTIGYIPAGAQSLPAVGAGEAVRIMTGAPLPPGADAVVPFEETDSDGDTVHVRAGITVGSCVRPAGLDVNPGDQILPEGTRLGAAQLAACASVGLATLSVRRRPAVAILTTGDELVDPGAALGPGQIYNSNAYGLEAAVQESGGTPLRLSPARDSPEALRDAIKGLPDADLILTSGGVSVGDFDYVKAVFASAGEVGFWRVRMRPGKPLLLASLARPDGQRVPVLGLPGNPTSTMVTFEVFGRPLIRRLLGQQPEVPKPLTARCVDRLDNRGGRETFFRVVLDDEEGLLSARLSGGQDSSMLVPLARADGLARVSAEVETVAPGETVLVYPFSRWSR